MNILVTGGAGYIGSVVAAELQAAGHRVTVLDNLSHGWHKAVPRQAELVVGDVADAAVVGKVLREHTPDAVMHFAAFIEAGESMRVPERYFRNNTAATLTLLEAIVACGVRQFVFSSTAAVYGDPEHTPICEDAPLRPANAYGESKLLVERMLEWFWRVHGLRYASLRYFNAAGATADRGEDHRPESHLIPLVLKVALGQSERITVFGSDYPTPDGTCVRDYVHVLDLASAHLLALHELDRRERVVYNLGTGRGFSVREVIETTRRVTGHAIPSTQGARRSGDPAVLVASASAIERDLGWRARHSDLESMVESAWQWHRRNREGYK